jgi:MFS family permease
VKFVGHKVKLVGHKMKAAPFAAGVTIYAFYAMQPYLLKLWGDEKAYGVAGLAAAIVAGAQIAGGLLVPHIGRIFRRRTTVLLTCEVVSVVVLAIVGFVPNFWVAVTLLILWGLMFSATMAGAAGLSQRSDSNRTARDRFVIRFAVWFKRRGRVSASTWQSRRHLELSNFLHP